MDASVKPALLAKVLGRVSSPCEPPTHQESKPQFRMAPWMCRPQKAEPLPPERSQVLMNGGDLGTQVLIPSFK